MFNRSLARWADVCQGPFFWYISQEIKKWEGSCDLPWMKENEFITGLNFFTLHLLESFVLFCFHVIALNVLGFKKLYSEALSRFPNTLGFQVSCRHSYCLNPMEFKLQEPMVNFAYDVVYAVCKTVCVHMCMFGCDLVTSENYSKCFTT